MLGFLEGLEEGWGDFAGLVVGDGVVGGGGDDYVVEEVDAEEFCGFAYSGGDFDVVIVWFHIIVRAICDDDDSGGFCFQTSAEDCLEVYDV